MISRWSKSSAGQQTAGDPSTDEHHESVPCAFLADRAARGVPLTRQSIAFIRLDRYRPL